MSHDTVRQADIAIAGGGVAGLALALMLRKTSLRVVVLEQGDDPSHITTGDILSPAAMGLLAELDIAQAVGRQPYPAVPIQRYELTHPYRGELAAIAVNRLAGTPGLAWGMDRQRLLALLRSRLKDAANVQIVDGARVSGLLRTTARCTGLRAQHRGGILDVRARLSVLAAGAASRLRRRAGMEPARQGPRHRWLLFTIPRPPQLDDVFLANVSTLGFVSLLPLPGHRARVAVLTTRGELRRWRGWELHRWRRELALRAPALLATPLQLEEGRVRIVEPAQVSTYHQPGLCLLGDAARTVHPILSHGMELALFDAVVLGRILAGTDLASDRALADGLDRYERASRVYTRYVRRGIRRFRNLLADSRLSRFALFVVVRLCNRLDRFDAGAARILGLGAYPLPRSLSQESAGREHPPSSV